jgi:3-oxoacyl-[acyl-carrier protein] reductase
MNIDLKGKRAVICGASRGIGRAIALACAEAGASVSICARGAEALEKTRADMAAHGQKAHAAPCDLAEKDQIACRLETTLRIRHLHFSLDKPDIR